MKKLLLFIVLIIGLSVFSHAEDINECKTDIYYGNGVWNEYEDATDSKDELESLIKDEIINGNSSLQTKYGTPKLAYNWGQGHLLDVLETYYQLRESGQLDGIGFYAAIAALTVKYPLITLSAVATQALMEPFTKDWESGNVDEMWQKYYNESFKLGHRVLLVSHSQGNLFANRIYNTITPTEYQNYFANLQVASPASGIKATKGGYVTLCEDPIINPIPGSMFGNANGSPGHAFVNAYLDQIDPYTKIVAGIKQLLPTLDSEISQWETDEEFDRDSCDYKIAVKHRWDPDVEIVEKVYPFNAAKKLYQAKDENGVPYYVKASCGGENILSDWSSKKTNECYMIDNPQEEKIVGKREIIGRYEGWVHVVTSAYGCYLRESALFFGWSYPRVETKYSNPHYGTGGVSGGTSSGMGSIWICGDNLYDTAYEIATQNYYKLEKIIQNIFAASYAKAKSLHGEENVEIEYSQTQQNPCSIISNAGAACGNDFRYTIFVYE